MDSVVPRCRDSCRGQFILKCVLLIPHLLPVRLPHKEATWPQLPFHNIDMNQIQNRAKDLSQGDPTSQLSGHWYNPSDLAHHHLSVKYHLNLSIDVSLCPEHFKLKLWCVLYEKPWVYEQDHSSVMDTNAFHLYIIINKVSEASVMCLLEPDCRKIFWGSCSGLLSCSKIVNKLLTQTCWPMQG